MPVLQLMTVELPTITVVANIDDPNKSVMAEVEVQDKDMDVTWRIRFASITPDELRCVAQQFEEAARMADEQAEDLSAEVNYRIDVIQEGI